MKDLNSLYEYQGVQTGSKTYEVLLVDDEEILRRLLRGIIGLREDIRLTTCESGTEAVAAMAARSAPFDLIITDLMMPEMNGQQLLEHVKRTAPDLPVVAFSGSLHDLPNDDCFDAVLGKPFSLAEVHQILARFCPLP